MIHSQDFLTLIVFAGALQGSLLTFALARLGFKNKPLWVLAGFMGLISVTLLGRNIDPSVYSQWPKLMLLQDMILFLYGPILLMFLQSYLIGTNPFRAINLVHLVPWLAFLLSILPILLTDNARALSKLWGPDLAQFWTVTAGAAICFNLGYLIAGFRLIRSVPNNLTLTHNAQTTLRALTLCLAILCACLLSWAYSLIAQGYSWLPEFEVLKYEPIWIGLSCFSYGLGYLILTHREFIQFKTQPVQKHSGQSFEMQEIKDEILHLFENDHIHLDSDLSLDKLAERLGLQRNIVSMVINRGFDCSYYELVNKYRVAAFQSSLKTSIGSASLLELAYEAGFNSKTTFNTAFKKVTGLTPTAYLNAQE